MSELEGGSSQSSATPSEGAGAASPAPSSAPQNPSSITPTSPRVEKGATSSPTPGVVPSATPYTPNWKFKAAGKEHEIPEYFRGVVKDAESEKQVRELHEKAYGLDLIKNNYQASQQQLQQFQKTVLPEYDKLKKTVQNVVMYRNNGDLDSVFESIGIQPQAVAKWMHQRLQMNDMSPEQRAIYENESNLRKQNYVLQERVASLSQTSEQTQLQNRAVELQSALAKPEVQSVAESYNQRLGDSGAFWNFVCQQADFMERSTGQRVNAEQAIQQTLKILGNSIVPQAQVPGNPTIPGVGMNPPAGQNPPVIPNITGARNASPTRKLARSVDDLRKLAKEMKA